MIIGLIFIGLFLCGASFVTGYFCGLGDRMKMSEPTRPDPYKEREELLREYRRYRRQPKNLDEVPWS